MKTNNSAGVGVKLVVFQLGVDLFAADVLAVDRVLRYSPPNSVPDVPRWVEGVTEHRGEVIPVIDLRRRIELAETTITPETRTLVLNTSTGRVGAIVDAVLEVAVVPIESMSPPPALFKGVATDVIVKAVTRSGSPGSWRRTGSSGRSATRPGGRGDRTSDPRGPGRRAPWASSPARCAAGGRRRRRGR